MASLAPPPDGNVTRAYVVAVPTIVTTVIAAILTIIRLYVRTRILNGLEWDDYFNAAAMVRELSSHPRVEAREGDAKCSFARRRLSLLFWA